MTDLTPGGMPFYLLIAGVAVLVVLARRIRIVGALLTIGLVGVTLALLIPLATERAKVDPAFERVVKALNLGGSEQQVVGKEMRVPMARDGHFWVKVRIGDAERRMLVDSGATVTAMSQRSAEAAGLELERSVFPVVLQTANGSIPAMTATAPELRIGNIVARDLPIVVSPAFGDMDVLGMNFLSRLKSWRVEGRTLILQPHHPQAVG
ncbi:TIGR02281 family clan AA aspartic protease [Sphingomonas sp. So64.6b]|uniref:retropepsin-like aspartic protease family protein n=1 Tax=Sphingomonas sp. So64.6b TaxID=2997354 RepID=UPI0015FFE463|nr:TIGR02281 family clan AA aspartic protease [Sphingomonas sp. So64.6b]QNA85112.1 TIGR02281 family clan AA aspartic protease [Sphingomonas sp. So64.6b]